MKGKRDERCERRKKSSPKGEAMSVVGNPHCAGETMPATEMLLAQEIVIK